MSFAYGDKVWFRGMKAVITDDRDRPFYHITLTEPEEWQTVVNFLVHEDYLKEAKKPKYHAQPTIYKGIRFKSKLEAGVAETLDFCKLPWKYEPASVLVPGRAGAIHVYKPDFEVDSIDGKFYLEVKGFKQGLQKLRGYAKGYESGSLKTPLYVTTKPDLADVWPVEQYLKNIKEDNRRARAFKQTCMRALKAQS